MAMNKFEKATRKKLRFQSDRGVATVEDLWDLPLESLNSMAKGLSKKLKEAGEEDFLNRGTPNVAATDDNLRFELVKFVINDRLDAAEAKKKAAAKKVKEQKLYAQLEKIQNAAFENLSEDEIKAQLAELNSDETED